MSLDGYPLLFIYASETVPLKELFNVLPVALQSRQARQVVQIVIMQILFAQQFYGPFLEQSKNELKVS